METHPQVSDWQSVPEARVDHVEQLLTVGGHECAVVWRQTHGPGLLGTHAVGVVYPHHVARVRLVQRHQVELDRRREKVERKKEEVAKNVQFMTSNKTGGGSLKCSFLSQILR